MTVDLDLTYAPDDAAIAELESWSDCASGTWPAALSETSAPTLEPGQLWLIEVAEGATAFSEFERHAIETANVVVYDRPLTAAIGGVLPLGGYAEPAPATGDFAVARCIGLAGDGWSVVRVIHRAAAIPTTGSLREFCRRLLARGVRADLPVSLVGRGRRLDTCLAAVAAVIDAWRGPEQHIALICSAIGNPAPRVYAVAANGLAG